MKNYLSSVICALMATAGLLALAATSQKVSLSAPTYYLVAEVETCEPDSIKFTWGFQSPFPSTDFSRCGRIFRRRLERH